MSQDGDPHTAEARPQDNDPQTAAIHHGEGPCLVIAGPGTGKTYVIVQRFAELVRQGIAPDNILCLTFTNRAANEMRERVERLLGRQLLEPPNSLTTYNSWAAGLVQDNLWRLRQQWPNVRIASGADHHIFLSEAIAEAKPDWLCNWAVNPGEGVPLVGPVIERAKQELITPEAYRAKAEALLKTARATPGADVEAAARHLDVAKIYAGLQRRYKEAGVIGHDDCIQLAATLLRSDPDLRAQCAARYRYIMVDEFQDTNTANWEMVRLLLGEPANLMVVADPDQSIYGFRGAAKRNLALFGAAFPQHTSLALPANRRSTPEIVAASRSVIERVSDREPRELRSIRPSGEQITVLHATHYAHEADAVVQMIEDRLAAGARPRDVAVLYRGHADMEPLLEGLRSHHIPYSSRGGGGLFRMPQIQDFLRLLEAVHDPYNNLAVLACLAFPAWGMSEAGQIKVTRALPSHVHSGNPLIRMLDEETVPDLSTEDRAAGKQIAQRILELAKDVRGRDVRDLYDLLMAESGFAGVEKMKHLVEIDQFTRNLSRLREIIGEFHQARSPQLQARIASRGALSELVEYLRLLERSGTENNVPLSPDLDAVQVMTIHSAKGLEWPYVIIGAAVEGKLPTPYRVKALTLPTEFVIEGADEAAAQRDEERRVAYTAMTRAGSALAFTYSDTYPGGGDTAIRRPTSFISDIAAENPELIRRVDAAPRLPLPPAPRAWPRRDLAAQEPLRLSFSSLSTFQRCPRRYQYASILRLPERRTPDTYFGTLIHGALGQAAHARASGTRVTDATIGQIWDSTWRESADELSDLDRAYGAGGSTGAGRSVFGDDDGLYNPDTGWRLEGGGPAADRIHAFGRRILTQYVSTQTSWRDPIMMVADAPNQQPKPMIERGFGIDVGDGIVLVGRIDLVVMRDGIPVVIDYKTGVPPQNPNLRSDEQMRIYACAVADMTGATTVRCEKHWVGQNKVAQVTFTAKDLARFRQTLAKHCREVKEAVQRGGVLRVKPSSWQCGSCPYRRICDQKDVGPHRLAVENAPRNEGGLAL